MKDKRKGNKVDLNFIQYKYTSLMKDIFGCSVECEEWAVRQIPLVFKTLATFLSFSFEDFAFGSQTETDHRKIRMVFIPDIDLIGYPAVLTFIQSLQNRFLNEEIVLGTERMSYNRAKTLISRNIAFMTFQPQVFLPALGLAVRNEREVRKSREKRGKWTPSQQALFLLLFYRNKEVLQKNEICRILNFSKMTLSRAINALQENDLLIEIDKGTINSGLSISDSAQDLAVFKGYLSTPIQKTVFIKREHLPKQALLSGISALGEKSILSGPEIEEYCISRNLWDENIQINEEEAEHTEAVKLEIWSYDPNCFTSADDGQIKTADSISIYASLMHDEDPRIQQSLQEMIAGYYAKNADQLKMRQLIDEEFKN